MFNRWGATKHTPLLICLTLSTVNEALPVNDDPSGRAQGLQSLSWFFPFESYVYHSTKWQNGACFHKSLFGQFSQHVWIMFSFRLVFTPSETFSFVLTGEDGSRRFGYCRRLLVCTSNTAAPCHQNLLISCHSWTISYWNLTCPIFIVLSNKLSLIISYFCLLGAKIRHFPPECNFKVCVKKALLCSAGLILWLYLDKKSRDAPVFWICLFLAGSSQPSGKGRRLPEVYCIVSRLGCFDLFSKVDLVSSTKCRSIP